MTVSAPTDRIMQALTDEVSLTSADARALAYDLQSILTEGTPRQITDLISRLVQAGVVILQGDVNIAGESGMLITRSSVQLASEQDVILEALQIFNRRLIKDEAAQTQVRVAEYLAALHDYCANLPYLTLYDVRPSKTLDEVYIPLRAQPQPRGDNDQRARRDSWTGEPLSIAQLMRDCEQTHTLILGEPGSGKSTLMRQMAQHAWAAPEMVGLAVPYLPVLVSLRRLTGEGSLETRLADALNAALPLTQDLPPAFFSEWPAHTGARWLILLDALDEVSVDEKPRLMVWFRDVLKRIGRDRIVVTSRLSGYTPGELDDQQFGHYILEPFTPSQTGQFAQKWFGNRASHFLEELDRVRAGDLRGTPLLLAVAARVYARQNSLPERRTRLYEHIIEVWLREAKGRGLKVELEQMSKVAKPALARLAMAAIEQPYDVDIKALSKVAATYFRKALGLSEDVARQDGRRFVEVMAKRSGVFIQRGNTYDFVHPTFRDYLAACAYVREWELDPEPQASIFIEKHWRDIAIRGVLLFILSLFSDQDVDVSSLLEPITRLPQHARFTGLALTEGIIIDQALSNYIVDHLLDLASAGTRWEGAYALSILGQLQGNQRAVEGLLALSCDANVDSWKQIRAGGALRELGEGDRLSVHAQSTDVDGWERLKAVQVLMELGQTDKAVQACLVLTCNEGVDYWIRAKAVEVLEKLGRCDDLATLAYDATLDVGVRIQVIKTLGELNLASELQKLTREIAADDAVRLAAAQELWQLGQRDDAADIFRTLARDEAVVADVRLNAAEVLGRQGRVGEAVSILLAMADHVTATSDTREQVAKVLMELGQVDKVIPILSDMIRDTKVDASMRVWATFALSELKRRDETAQACLMLALDEALESEIRLEATRALQRLGWAGEAAEAYHSLIRTAQTLTELERIDDAASILVALASDGAVDIGERERATFMLWQLDRKYQAAQACLALISDKSLAFDMRREATDALERMGFLDEAVQARDALIRDVLLTEGAHTRDLEMVARSCIV